MLVCVMKNGKLPVKSLMRWQTTLLCQCCVLACACSYVRTFTFGPFIFKRQFGQNKALFSPNYPLKVNMRHRCASAWVVMQGGEGTRE